MPSGSKDSECPTQVTATMPGEAAEGLEVGVVVYRAEVAWRFGQVLPRLPAALRQTAPEVH